MLPFQYVDYSIYRRNAYKYVYYVCHQASGEQEFNQVEIEQPEQPPVYSAYYNQHKRRRVDSSGSFQFKAPC